MSRSNLWIFWQWWTRAEKFKSGERREIPQTTQWTINPSYICQQAESGCRQESYLHHRIWADISSGRGSKNETITLDMKIRQTIRHEQYRRGISSSCRSSWLLLLLLLGGLRCFGSGNHLGLFWQIIPEFNFAKECFRMGSFVCGSGGTAVVLGQDSVSTRRKYEKVADHDYWVSFSKGEGRSLDSIWYVCGWESEFLK